MLRVAVSLLVLTVSVSGQDLVSAEGLKGAHTLKGGALQRMEVAQIVDENYRRQAIARERERKKATVAFPIWVVPTSANNPGLFGGVFFKTRIVLTNPTNLTFNVAAQVCGPNGLVDTREIDLPANSSKVWDDFLGTAFGYSGPAAIEFDSWLIPVGGSSDYDFAVTAEVYTDSPNGRFKTTVVNGLGPDSVTGLNKTISAGVNVNSSERTNIGVYNESILSTMNVMARVFAGNVLVEIITFSVPPKGWAQKPLSAQVTNGTIEWTTDGSAYLWTVGVDNRSNDGTLTYPVFYLAP